MRTPADQPPDHPLVPPSNPGGASTNSVPPLHTRPAPSSPPAFPSAAPQPAVSGYGAPAWSQQPPAWGAPQQVGAASAEPALTKAGTALWWAIGAAVGAFVVLET